MDETPHAGYGAGDGPAGDPPPGAKAADAHAASAASSRFLAELSQLGKALKHLFGAQWHLFVAELSLARGAVSLLFAAGLAATVLGVGLSLTTLALIGVALARWFGSWLWALGALAAFQGLLLIVAITYFRRGLHWMSLPATRDEFGAMIRDTKAKASADAAPASDVPSPVASRSSVS
ncbi:ABC transporter ATP-binding protein [Dyella sp.]|jgi:hypothetical protein|uniref:ABC transporter ATP-binding protein n=1 Tax=Dyella sp. TaxID=1869338 RepID=UPI002D76564F|nr:ABC transporter ATP-binding protein [Dyella sp.]HET6431666.1 ABC transporter ATP-binding protein [Dyella sp.]